MKRINSYKIISGIIPLMFVLFSVQTINAQQRVLFNYHQNPALTHQQQHYADAWTKLDWVSSYHFITISQKDFKGNFLNLNLPGNVNVDVVKRELDDHANGSFSWLGEIDNPKGNADFVVNKDMVTARISSLGFTYLIYPLTDGMHILLECNGSKMPLDESPEGYEDMIKRAVESHKGSQTQKHVDPELNGQEMIGGNCKVRILVAYTDDANVNLADPVSFCQSCIDATNTAYANSSVYFQCEMALAILETYAESLNSTTDKIRFHDTADGYMDDVHDYRSAFDADMCILITENLQSGICGEAYTVANSTYTDPFCVVTRGCAVGNLSFPHELGHLYGCRHDPYVDGTSTPYSYGHGYVYLAGQWRTVMAYNNYCSDNGSSCTRIQYFSNPAISYSGHATGVANANDNESALEASVPNISSLETTVANKAFATNRTFSSGEFSDVIGGTSVTNNANVTFQFNSGSSGSWRAGTYMDMKPGFRAVSGCDFVAYLDNCTALRPANDEPQLPQKSVVSKSNSSLFASPNPFTDQFDLTMNLSVAGKVEIQLYNMVGEKVNDLISTNFDMAGPYKFKFDGADLKPGIYLVVVTTPSGISTIKINKAL